MRILEFEVEKQRLRKNPDCDFSNIVPGTSGYLKAVFHFNSPDWIGCKKAASFWLDDREYPVLLDNENSCIIPADALMGGRFEVSVLGMREGSYRILTGKTKVKQEVN